MSRPRKCRVCGTDDLFQLVVWPPAHKRVGPRTYECLECLNREPLEDE